ncbi:MAG: flavodoxin family protein [Tissierellia bacterium]|nr:flavodoxin family protein [Bacillota bacterium]NLL22375.1 flavodoxin family protein [Tissierellia bacterium]
MKVLAINGSPRVNGNTAAAIEVVKEELVLHGVELERFDLGLNIVRSCAACNHCARIKKGLCLYNDDLVNEGIKKIAESDGLILASPVHYSGISGTMKSFLDRVFYASSRAPVNPLRHKTASAFVCVRRAGGLPAFQSLMNYLTYAEMVIATGSYWPVIYGAAPGEVLQDTEGMAVLKEIARNMAWIMKNLKDGKEAPPQKVPKQAMNFIRNENSR